MILIGETLNSSVPRAFKAIEARDDAAVGGLVRSQTACGADYLDINAGLFPDEAEKLLWLAQTVRANSEAGICLDSVNADSIAYVLERVEIPKLLVNSITLENARFQVMLPLVRKYNASVIALPIAEKSMPHSAEEIEENARGAVEALTAEGIAAERIFVDILVSSAGMDWEAPMRSLQALRRLRSEYDKVNFVAGLSNISYGLPKRAYINSAMAAAGICAGLNSLIMDVTNKDMYMAMKAALLIAGRDEYAEGYLEAYRKIFETSEK